MIKIKQRAYRVSQSGIAIVIPAAVVRAYDIEIGDTLLMDIQDIIKPINMLSQG